jgi:predicted ArsR family transcriptional regulator
MTTSDTILNLLATDQATTDAIAETLKQPAVIVAAFCCDLETAGLATSHALGNPDAGRKLSTWRITESGKARAASLQPA